MKHNAFTGKQKLVTNVYNYMFLFAEWNRQKVIRTVLIHQHYTERMAYTEQFGFQIKISIMIKLLINVRAAFFFFASFL